jgi:1-deoxy-D-xylulose-5-phosphate synthase
MIMDVALQNLHVVFCLDRAGLVGEDGPTHHGVFDLSYLRTIPNMMVLAPCDEAELTEALHTALAAEGPVAIRYPRGAARGVEVPAEPEVWEAAHAQIRSRGTDVALLGVGRAVAMCEAAAEILAAQGVSASVVNARWVKPLDFETVSWAASEHRLVVTVEENTSMGGFGGAVCEALADLGLLTPVLRMAVPDCFVTHGAMARLLSDVGLTAESIAAAASGRLDDIPLAVGAEQDEPAVAEARARDAEPYRRHPR